MTQAGRLNHITRDAFSFTEENLGILSDSLTICKSRQLCGLNTCLVLNVFFFLSHTKKGDLELSYYTVCMSQH